MKARSAQVRLELQRQAYLASVCGVDLTGLPDLSTLAVEVIISETGLDMKRGIGFEIGKELTKCGVALGINADEYR